MDMDKIEFLMTAFTFLGILTSFFFALKSEMRKSREQLIKANILVEKRHSAHEQRLSIIEERIANYDMMITFRLDEISMGLNDMNERMNEHLKEVHYE